MPIPPLNRDARKKKNKKKPPVLSLYSQTQNCLSTKKIMHQPQPSSSFLFPYPAYAATAPANPMPHHRPLSFADIMMLSPTAPAPPKTNTSTKNKPKSNPTRNADPMLVDSRGPSKPPRTKPAPMMVITPVTSPAAATTAASILLAGAKKDPASSSAIKAHPAPKAPIPPLHLHDDYTSNIMLVEDTFNIFVHILTDTGSPTPDPDAAARWTRPPSPPSSPMDQDSPIIDPLANLLSDEEDASA